jgi:hypothetical protein
MSERIISKQFIRNKVEVDNELEIRCEEMIVL